MESIQISSYKSTGLSNDFAQLSKIEYKDDSVGGGGFGEVYPCLRLDGNRPSRSIVVKVLFNSADQNLKTIQKIQTALRKKHKELISRGSSLLEEYPGLMGVPLFSFHGVKNGSPVSGYGMYNLNELGFYEFKKVIRGKAIPQFNALFNDDERGFKLRIKMAYQFAKTMNFFHEMRFLHADLKDESLFIDVKTGVAAVIDLDSGAVGADVPTTKGAAQEWYAPEIADIVGSDKAGLNKRINWNTDNYSIAVGLHYILFGFHPYFFLKNSLGKDVIKYLEDAKWPNVPISHPSKNDSGDAKIGTHQYYFAKLSAPAQKAFKTAFNSGFGNPKKRIQPHQWLRAFAIMWDKPEILRFEASDTFVSEKKRVRLTWSTKNVARVFINNAEIRNQSHYDFVPKSTSVMRLKAINEAGVETEKECKIEVSKEPPTIVAFESDRDTREGEKPVVLSWRSVKADRMVLMPDNIDVTHLNSIEVKPLKATKYVLEATSFFGAKATAEIQVKVSSKAPDINKLEASHLLRTDKTPVTISWEVAGAEKIRLEPGNMALDPSGTHEVDPRKKTVYTLVATSMFGVVSTKELTVEVSDKPPVIEYFRSDKSIRENADPIQLSWKVKGAESIVLEPFQEVVDEVATYSVEPMKDTEYTLTTTTMFGVEKKQKLLVEVSKVPPEIIEFSSELIELQHESYEVRWKTKNAKKIEIEPNVGDVTGKNSMVLKEPYDIELVATSMFGYQSKKKLGLKPLFKKEVKEEHFKQKIEPGIPMLSVDEDLFKNKPNDNLFKK